MKREFTIAILFLLLLAGCTKEKEVGGTSSDGNAILKMTIPQTKAQSSYDESSISSARLIVFHSKTLTGAKKMVLNTTDFVEVDKDKMQCRELIPAGYINVYLVTNEASTGIAAALDAITASSTEADLENIRLNYGTNPVAPPITMFRVYKGLRIVSNGTADGKIFNADGTPIDDSDWGLVERNAVKLNFKLICDYKILSWNSAGTPIVFESVTLKSLPKKPYLTSRQYGFSDDSDYFDEETYNITTGDHINRTNGVETKDDALVFLVPEHLVGDKSRYTYVEINCSWGSTALRYKLALGQGLGVVSNAEMMNGSALLSDLNLLRNTEYRITATIKEMGESEGVEIFQSIEPWDDIDVYADPLERQLNVSAITATVSSLSRERIYFWTNQSEVSVDAKGYDGGSGSFPSWNTDAYNVSEIFEGLGNGEANISFNHNTGMGYIDITPLFDFSASDGTYYRSIFLNAGGLKREIKIAFNHIQHPLQYDYVGTFHRKNQTGERVIYMPNTGTWSAKADADWVLLSTSRSRDNMLFTDTPGEAEDYKVTDGQTIVSGTGNIYFRVGMKSATASNRYSKITINCSGGPKTIWVRQGEDADYLMRPEDAYENDPGVGSEGNWRPAAAKFSPYNLTSPYEPEPSGTQVDVNGGEFTQYPTQAGVLWQWANTIKPRYAYHPVNPASGNVPTWDSNYPSTYWNTLGATYETCPAGYRRPNDGPTDGKVDDNGSALNNATTGYTFSYQLANSEMRQSLYLNPDTGLNYYYSEAQAGNTVWGYYADGFFDRRVISSSVTNFANTAVSSTGADVAYIGRLLYNKNNNASLFFPAPANRDLNTGSLNDTGELSGAYWSSSSNGTGGGWNMRFSSSIISQYGSARSYGYSIRCVKNEIPASFPAYPGVIGYDPVKGDLNLDGRGFMVYFKFGSVVAMYAGLNGSTFNVAKDIAFNPMSDQSVITGYGVSSTTLPDVPGYQVSDWNAGLQYNISDASYHNQTNIAMGKGDPCKLVGYTVAQVRSGFYDNGIWLMPKDSEHSGFTLGESGWITKASPNDPTLWNGHTFPQIKETYYGQFLPAAGYRSTSGGVYYQGSTGIYWSSTPHNSDLGNDLYFWETSVVNNGTGAGSYGLSYGIPVRCVRQTVTVN